MCQPYAHATLLRFINTAPSPTQASYIRSLIASYEAEHTMLTCGISELTSKRDQITSELTKWRQVLCPIRRIPSELLAEIFSYFMAPLKDAKYTWELNGRPRDNPLVLTHVCAVWRRVAFETSRLWTHLKLVFIGVIVTDYSIATLKDFLSHSQPHPINLELIVREGYVPNVDRLLEGLIPSFDRLKDLTLNMRWEGYKPLCGTFPPSMTMPSLESVDIQGVENYMSVSERDTDLTPTPIFSNAPSLRRATLWDRTKEEGLTQKPSRFLKKLALPWSQLTELSAGDIFKSFNDARVLFRQCTSLEKCDFANVPCWNFQEEGPLSATTVSTVFTSLRELTINFEYTHPNTYGGVFFQSFHMPMLQKLSLSAEEGDSTRDSFEYLAFLFVPSGSQITHLTLNSVQFPGTIITDVFQRTPQLVYFHCELCSVALEDSTFNALTYQGSNGPPPLVPCLRTLSIQEFGDLEGVTADAVMNMIRSRWWNDEDYQASTPQVARWKKVYITWDSDGERLEMSDEQEAEFERWQEEGLDVTF